MLNHFKYYSIFFLLFIFNNGISQNNLKEFQTKIESYLESNLDSAYKYSELLLHSAYEKNDKIEEHHAFNYLAHIAYRKGNKIEALENFKTSLRIRNEFKNVTETANTLNWIGRIHHESTDYDKALEYYFMSLEKLKEKPDSSYILSTLNNVVRLYLDIGDNENILKYNQQSLLISQLTENNIEYANACNLRGIFHQNLQQLDSAEIYYQKALSYYSESNLPHKIAHQHNNLAIISFFKGDLAESYNNFLFAMSIRKQLTDTASYTESLRNLGDYYFFTESYDSSLYYYNNSLQLSISINSKTDLKETYISLSELHYELKNYKEAYDYHLKYSDLQETIFSIDQFEKLREMEAKYQFQNQNEQLRIIAENNKRLNQTNEELETQRTNSKYWVYGLIVLCSLLLVFSFVMYKSK